MAVYDAVLTLITTGSPAAISAFFTSFLVTIVVFATVVRVLFGHFIGLTKSQRRDVIHLVAAIRRAPSD